MEVPGGPKERPLGLTRSRTFTGGIDSLRQGANLHLDPGASSSLRDRPASFLFAPGSAPRQEFKLFGDVGPVEEAPRQEFKLFGEVEPMGEAPRQEFKLFGDVGPVEEAPRQDFKLFDDVGPVEEAPPQEFKLFGDVELSSSAAAEPQQQQQQQQEFKLFPDVAPVAGPAAQPGGSVRASPFLQARRPGEPGQGPGAGRQASPEPAAAGPRQADLPVAPLTNVVVSRMGEESPQASVVHWLEQASLTPLGSAASGREARASGGSSVRRAAAGRASRSPSPAARPKRPPAPPSAPPEDGNA